jgi:hypothetical protein
MKRRRAVSPPAKEREALFRKNKRHAYYRKHNEFFQENKRKSKATPRVYFKNELDPLIENRPSTSFRAH